MIGSTRLGSPIDSIETTGASSAVRKNADPKVRTVRRKFIKKGEQERARRLGSDPFEADSAPPGPALPPLQRMAAIATRHPGTFRRADTRGGLRAYVAIAPR